MHGCNLLVSDYLLDQVVAFKDTRLQNDAMTNAAILSYSLNDVLGQILNTWPYLSGQLQRQSTSTQPAGLPVHHRSE